MMTPEQAAKIIQRAWFQHLEAEERARDAFLEEYNKEMWDTYYHECCTPIDHIDTYDAVYCCHLDTKDHDEEEEEYDPPDEYVYYRY
jgi:hypothetical protein